MVQNIVINDITELGSVAGILLQTFPNARLFALFGEMGSGKTTFIKQICEKLEVTYIVNSPTFAIVHEYHTKLDEPVFHFDFYRIKSENELYGLGYEEYVFSGSYCFIEWPENFENLLPENTVKVKISVDPENKIRTVSF